MQQKIWLLLGAIGLGAVFFLGAGVVTWAFLSHASASADRNRMSLRAFNALTKWEKARFQVEAQLDLDQPLLLTWYQVVLFDGQDHLTVVVRCKTPLGQRVYDLLRDGKPHPVRLELRRNATFLPEITDLLPS